MATLCGTCGGELRMRLQHGHLFYCSTRCQHAAGSRIFCSVLDNCGCTPYAKRRRVLRETRQTVRDMWDILEDNDLLDELADVMVPNDLDEPRDGPGEPDESSDVEDETLTLRAIVAARTEADVLHRLVNSAASLAECERLRAETARAQAETARVQAESACEIARLQAENDALRQI